MCAAAGFAWEWNDVAIAQLALLGHTIGLHTLHPRIYRMPSDARLEFRDGKLTTTRLSPFSSWRWDEDELDESFASLKQAFEDCLSGEDQPILSLSGGYDSRLLLALCHWKGLRPHLFVSGTPDTSDRKIATLAAELMDLPIECIVLKPDDYLRHGEEISHATSGVKTVEHWHTWHYSRQLNDKSKLHLVGSNGEFARTYYNDWLSRSRVLRCLGLSGLRGYLLARMLSRARRYSRHHALSVFASIPSVLHSLETDLATYPSSFLPALDTFYATERVRHFIGSGIACYAEFTRPRSPFLDRSWMRSVAAVKRQWKEDDRYHRMATEALASPLARIPYNCDPDGGPPRKHSAFNDLVDLTSTRDFIIESDQLGYFLPQAERIKIFSGGATQIPDCPSRIRNDSVVGLRVV